MDAQRPRGTRRARRLAGVAGLVALVVACAERQPPLPPELQAWAQGPARWLMLPAELREFSHLHDPAAARAFIEDFWRRR